MWELSVFGLIPAKKAVAYFVGYTLLILCLYTYVNLLIKSEGKRFQLVKEVFALLVVLVIEYVWMNTSIYEVYNGIILLNFGILMSLIICKMIVCSVTKVILGLA
jgi:hypothetical protein